MLDSISVRCDSAVGMASLVICVSRTMVCVSGCVAFCSIVVVSVSSLDLLIFVVG